jgi:hypothetical protein
MANRRPEHGLTEADGAAAIAMLQHKLREPEQQNDDVMAIDASRREPGLTIFLPCVPNCRVSWRSSSHE